MLIKKISINIIKSQIKNYYCSIHFPYHLRCHPKQELKFNQSVHFLFGFTNYFKAILLKIYLYIYI
jgi:hypothetical protein